MEEVTLGWISAFILMARRIPWERLVEKLDKRVSVFWTISVRRLVVAFVNSTVHIPDPDTN